MSTTTLLARAKWLALPVFCIAAISILVACYAPSFWVASALHASAAGMMAGVILISASVCLVMMLVLVTAKLCNWQDFGFFTPDWQKSVRVLLLAFVTACLLAFSGLLVDEKIPDQVRQVFSQNAAMLFLLVVIGASIQEEIIFRGAIQGIGQRLCRQFSLSAMVSTWSPMITSAVLFGLLHLPIGGRTAAAATVLGLLTGYARANGGGLVVAITCHAVFNAASFARLVFN
jgi:membrane protease YdiL (CAAX protease family)